MMPDHTCEMAGDDKHHTATAAAPLDERRLADALVADVCRCGPRRHDTGYPYCATARRAARTVLGLIEGDAR